MSTSAKRKQKYRKGQSEDQKNEARVKNAQNMREKRTLDSETRDKPEDITVNRKRSLGRPKMYATPEEAKEQKLIQIRECKASTPVLKNEGSRKKREERATFPFRQIIIDLQNREMNIWAEYFSSKDSATGDDKLVSKVQKMHKRRLKRRRKFGMQRIYKLLKVIEERSPVAEVLNYGCNEIFFYIVMLTPKRVQYGDAMNKMLTLLKNFQMPEPRDSKQFYVFQSVISSYREEYLAIHTERNKNKSKFDPISIYHELRQKYEKEIERLLGIIRNLNPVEVVLNYSKSDIVQAIFAVTSHLVPNAEQRKLARIVADVSFSELQKHDFLDGTIAEKPEDDSVVTTDDDLNSIPSRDSTSSSGCVEITSETSSDTTFAEIKYEDENVIKEWINDCNSTYKHDRETLDNELMHDLWDLVAQQEEEKEQQGISTLLVKVPDANSMDLAEKEIAAKECVDNGNIFFSKTKYKYSIICSTKALEYVQNYIPALLLRAKARLALDWFKPAMEDVEAVLEMDEDNFEAQRLETRAQNKFADAYECEILHDCDMGTKETDFTLGPGYDGIDYSYIIAELKYENSKKQIKEELSRDKIKVESADSIKQELQYPLHRESYASCHDDIKIKREPMIPPSD